MGIGKKGGAAKAGKTAMDKHKERVTNRPPTRKIVRWSGMDKLKSCTQHGYWLTEQADTLDRKLLLCIQSACNTENVKVPWKTVAKLMGGEMSEGAIVQHLAKTRSRLDGEGVPVPPALRRGGGGATKSKASRAASVKKEQSGDTTESDSDYAEDKGKAAKTKKGKKKAASKVKARDDSPESEVDVDEPKQEEELSADSGDDGEEGDEGDEVDEEYVAAGAPFLQYPIAGQALSENQPGSEYQATENMANSREATVTSSVEMRGKMVVLKVPGGRLQNIMGHEMANETGEHLQQRSKFGNLAEIGNGSGLGTPIGGVTLQMGNAPLAAVEQYPNTNNLGYQTGNFDSNNTSGFNSAWLGPDNGNHFPTANAGFMQGDSTEITPQELAAMFNAAGPPLFPTDALNNITWTQASAPGMMANNPQFGTAGFQQFGNLDMSQFPASFDQGEDSHIPLSIPLRQPGFGFGGGMATTSGGGGTGGYFNYGAPQGFSPLMPEGFPSNGQQMPEDPNAPAFECELPFK
jgi:hypothetical protein